MRRLLCCSTMGLLLSLATIAPPAGAQPAEEEDAEATGETAAEPEADAAEPSGDTEAAGEEDKAKQGDEAGEGEEGEGEEAKEDPLDPSEDPTVGYHFLGFRFRDFIVPKFIMNIFAEGGATTNVFSFGPEYVYRRDNLQYNVALSYADYSMDSILFKGTDDLDSAYERVWSSLKVLYLTFDLLYEVPIKEGMFAFLVGGGVGIGIVFGNLYRHQVYPLANPTNPDASNVNGWADCRGPNDPDVRLDPTHPYCDTDNSHYPGADGSPYSEPSWANGGSKPSIFPYLSIPQLSFRFKPIKQLNTRFDAGFSISGFYLGLAAHYGF